MCETGEFHNLVADLRLNTGCISLAEDKWLESGSRSCQPPSSVSGCWVPASPQGSGRDDGGGEELMSRVMEAGRGELLFGGGGKVDLFYFYAGYSLDAALREWQRRGGGSGAAMGTVGPSGVRDGQGKCREQFICKKKNNDTFQMCLQSAVSFNAPELSKFYLFSKNLIRKRHFSALTGSWAWPTWRTDGPSFSGGSRLQWGRPRPLHETTTTSNSKNVQFGSETHCGLSSGLAWQRAR